MLVKYKQVGCEIEWVAYLRSSFVVKGILLIYHLGCVDLEQTPRSWVCAACEVLSRPGEEESACGDDIA
jgi:hypothetical protein